MTVRMRRAIEELAKELRAQGRTTDVDHTGGGHYKLLVDGRQFFISKTPRDEHHAIDNTRKTIQRYVRAGKMEPV